MLSQPNSDGLHPNSDSDVVQPNSDGLHPNSDSDVVQPDKVEFRNCAGFHN